MRSRGNSTATIAIRQAPVALGDLIRSLPVIRRKRRSRHPCKPSTYLAWKRLRLLAAVAEKPGIGTLDAALGASMKRQHAGAALSKLAQRGYLSFNRVGRSHRQVWSITPEGLRILCEALSRRCTVLHMGMTPLDGISHLRLRTPTVSVLLEATHGVVQKLTRLGWRRSLVSKALRVHRIDYILRQIREIEGLKGVRNPGALLRFRLLVLDRDQRRREGLAGKVLGGLSQEVRKMYLRETEDMPRSYYTRLAYSLRKISRKGRKVLPGDVSGMASSVRKRFLNRFGE